MMVKEFRDVAFSMMKAMFLSPLRQILGIT
ncbi:MAG: hypothetical protein CM15mP58_18710 [Burkholderiaceae bacterium]|nr:MAG: hypothetical protein CM15mP58_18710 [Burkholderiaceae bacterium]